MYPTRYLLLTIAFVCCMVGMCQESHKLTGTVIGTGVSVDYNTGNMSTTVNTRQMGFDATGIDTPIYNNEYADDAIYTLSGQRVEAPLPVGIYIQGGKKIIVK